jgi:hypothetical protein
MRPSLSTASASWPIRATPRFEPVHVVEIAVVRVELVYEHGVESVALEVALLHTEAADATDDLRPSARPASKRPLRRPRLRRIAERMAA